jgi:dipeptidyl aminopeptidase/acylaminoacyl peptidase
VVDISEPYMEMLKIPRISPVSLSFDVSRDGRSLLYSSNASGNLQLYRGSTKPGSTPIQLTRGKNPVNSGLFSPNGREVVFCKDRDGNETYHMYLLPVDGGKPRRLTPTARRMWGLFDWSPDGKEVTRSVAMKKHCGLETVNIATGECFMLKEPTPLIGTVLYSPNGKYIACDAMTAERGRDILVIKRDDPSDTIVYSIKNNSFDESPCFSPDGKRLAFASDASGVRQIVIQDFQGESRQFLELARGEEVYGLPVWGPKSDRVFYISSKHSRTVAREHKVDHKSGEDLPFPMGTIESVRILPDGSMVALHSSMISPPAILLLRRRSKSAVSLTPRDHGFDPVELTRPESVWYKSFDGLRIHAWYLPAASESTSGRAVVWVHGGPAWQIYDRWADVLLLRSLSLSGFSVIAPNIRGSTGYGAKFMNLNIGDLGGGDLEDVVCAGEWLRRVKNIQRSRIAVGGASYGGYLALLALTARPSAFAAGVSDVPITDWLASIRLSDAAFASGIEGLWGGGIASKEKIMRRRSPMTHVSRIRAPVLIKAGEADARCPIPPIMSFVKRLKEMGHPHEFILEEAEGHMSSMGDWRSSSREIRSIINFLERSMA